MRCWASLLLLCSSTSALFVIQPDTKSIGLGRSVVISVNSSFARSDAGTVFWPFVNGSQWGAFVTCAVTHGANECSLSLPLPYVGDAAIQLVVLKEGRNWCQSGACVYPSGTPLPTSSVVNASNVVTVSVQPRSIVRPALPAGHSACLDYESWFTPHNFQAWLPRPGASGIPLVGMYNSSNVHVMRQHLIWFADAGVDCLLLDWSNNLWGGIPWSERSVGIQEIINDTTLLIDQIDQVRREGVIPAPQVVIMVGLSNGPPADPHALADELSWMKANYVDKYPSDSFLRVPGDKRPVAVVLDTSVSSTPSVNLTADFAVRWMGTQLQYDPALGSKYGFWSWMDGTFSPVAALRPDGSAEALTATPAFFAGQGWLGSTAAGQHDGSTFVRTMQAALAAKPSVLLICQWNEFAGQPDAPNTTFVDIYNSTFSNDMEPVSLTECAYVRKDDRGQLPVCNTGWGYFNLNILAASLAVYRETISGAPSPSSVVTLVSPSNGDFVPARATNVKWAVIGPASVFDVAVDGVTIAANVKCCEIDFDARNLTFGPHKLVVTAVDGFTRYLLSRTQVDEPLSQPAHAAATVLFNVEQAAPLPPVTSHATGFANIGGATSYEYGPSIIQENGVYYNFYCAPAASSTGSWDSIRLVTSRDGQNWGDQKVVLQGSPLDKWSANSTCDPSIVKFRGVYFLYHTCINVANPPDGYTNNRICVALSDSVTGPFRSLPPVIQNLKCDKDYQKIYCIGQPSAIVDPARDLVVVYYSSIGAPGDPTEGPNGGRILAQASSDGIHFTPYGGEIYRQHDTDVKFDRSTQTYVMVQGDVGSTRLSYSLSQDGQNWLPFDNSSRTVQTNPSLPSPCQPPCSNNNPGLASFPDGSFHGATFTQYGSSYPAPDPWGAWHLYRSELTLSPALNDCSGCAALGCDMACSQVKGTTSIGVCEFPGSKDPGKCCRCDPYDDPKPCSSCAPAGCVNACVGAGHTAGICGPAKDPSDCCICVDG